MAFELFKLAGSIFIDTKEADKSLSKTDKKAQSFGATFGKIAGIVGGVATTIIGSATAIGGAMVATAEKTSETADAIDKASIRMGLSTEQFQEYAYVAGQCGIETATLEQACKKLEGTGLDFNDAIAQIMSLDSAEERASMTAELFGDKLAYTLSPMIQQSGQDFEDLKNRAHELGLVMSDEAIQNGVKFGDLLSDLKQSFEALAGQIGSALFPILNQAMEYVLQFIPMLSDYMAKFAPISIGLMEQLLPFLFEIVDQIFPIMVDLASQLMPIFVDLVGSILPILASIIQAILPLFVNIIKTLMPMLVEIMASLLPLITALLPILQPIIELLLGILAPLVDLISAILPPVIALVTHIVEVIVPILLVAINLVKDLIVGLVETLVGFFKPMIDDIIKILKNLIDFIVNVFTGNWKGALENLLNIGKNILNIFIDYFAGFANVMIKSFNNLVNGIMGVVDKIPGVDIPVGFANIPEINIPHLEKGGTLTSPGRVLVGEKAPEILDLPAGARVTPLDKVGGVTREDIAEAMKEALLSVGISLELHADEGALFDRIESVNTSYRKRHGGASRLA